MTHDRLEFMVEVNDHAGGHQICVYVSLPAVMDHQPGCWTCLAGWTGSMALERPAFGATALQAVSLAFPMLEELLQLGFPDAEFVMDGRPFLLRSTDG